MYNAGLYSVKGKYMVAAIRPFSIQTLLLSTELNRRMASLTKVFVYGTLKRDEPNHHWLTKSENGSANFIGAAKCVDKYPLVIASRYNIPFLLAAEGIGKNVKGEVYEVDETMLGNLDILESHPKCYERKIRQVMLEDSEDTISVWIYLLHKYKPEMLDLPHLQSYESKGDHGLQYIDRYTRPKNSTADFWIDVKQ